MKRFYFYCAALLLLMNFSFYIASMEKIYDPKRECHWESERDPATQSITEEYGPEKKQAVILSESVLHEKFAEYFSFLKQKNLSRDYSVLFNKSVEQLVAIAEGADFSNDHAVLKKCIKHLNMSLDHKQFEKNGAFAIPPLNPTLEALLVERIAKKNPFLKVVWQRDKVLVKTSPGMPTPNPENIMKYGMLSEQNPRAGEKKRFYSRDNFPQLLTIHGDNRLELFDSKTGKLFQLWNPYVEIEKHCWKAGTVVAILKPNSLYPSQDVGVFQTVRDQMLTFRPHIEGNPSAIALNDAGTLLVSGSNRGDIVACNLETWPPLIQHIGTMGDAIGAICCSPGKSKFIAIAANFLINIVGYERKRSVKSLAAHDCPVDVLAFNRDQDLLASGSIDHDVRIWSVPLGYCLHHFFCSSPQFLCFSDEDSRLIVQNSEGFHEYFIFDKQYAIDIKNLSLLEISLIAYLGKQILLGKTITFENTKLREIYSGLPNSLKSIVKKHSSWRDWIWL